MIRVYQEGEFPRRYVDIIRMNGINPLEVKLVIVHDDSNYGIKELVSQLGMYEYLGTVTDQYIYIVYR